MVTLLDKNRTQTIYRKGDVMKSQSDLVSDFSKGKEKRTASNMFIDGDTLYSYGHHFPMLVRMPNWGKDKYLLNADVYSSSTSQHQAQCARLATVQIPFSALNSALAGERSRWATSRMDFEPEKLHLIDQGPERWDETGRWIWQHNRHEVTIGQGQPWEHTKTVYDDKVLSQADYEKLPEDEKEHCIRQKERRPEACVIRYGRKYYLSSMDGANYFISLLPGKVETVDQAFEMLKPAAVNGSPYHRQGEWFFVPVDTKVPRKEIKKQQYLINREKELPRHHRVRDYAVQVGYKYPLVRGTVRHDNRDHPMLKLGEEWHMAIESNHKMSWGAAGNVD
jgi:hypothetical protein